MCDAVIDALTFVAGGDRSLDAQGTRAVLLSLRMAADGWRFYPCYSEGSMQQHARIFSLVNTHLIDRLAQEVQQE